MLLPATMKLLGDWNWYLPRWLEWLPGRDREPASREPAPIAINPWDDAEEWEAVA